MKVMTILVTRPEIIKLSRVIAELDRHTTHVLVHTGQNYDYELNEIFFREMAARIRRSAFHRTLTTPNPTTRPISCVDKAAV